MTLVSRLIIVIFYFAMCCAVPWIHMGNGGSVPSKWFIDLIESSDSNYGIWLTYEKPLEPVLLLSYALAGLQYIYFPNSTWTQGRNKLYEVALSHNRQYEFYWFYDDDVTISANDFDRIRTTLDSIKVKPALAVIPLNRRDLASQSINVQESCGHDFDAIANGFHWTSAPILLPYSTVFDNRSWWLSQAVIITLTLNLYPHSVLTIPGVRTKNKLHRPYKRGLLVTHQELINASLAIIEKKGIQCGISMPHSFMSLHGRTSEYLLCPRRSCYFCNFFDNYSDVCRISHTQSPLTTRPS